MIIRKPRLSTLLNPTYAKHHFRSVKRYITNTPELPQKQLQWIPYIKLGISLQPLGKMI